MTCLTQRYSANTGNAGGKAVQKHHNPGPDSLVTWATAMP